MHLLVNFSRESVQNRLVASLYRESKFDELLYEDENLTAERNRVKALLDACVSFKRARVLNRILSLICYRCQQQQLQGSLPDAVRRALIEKRVQKSLHMHAVVQSHIFPFSLFLCRTTKTRKHMLYSKSIYAHDR